jgi:hypothetical protein
MPERKPLPTNPDDQPHSGPNTKPVGKPQPEATKPDDTDDLWAPYRPETHDPNEPAKVWAPYRHEVTKPDDKSPSQTTKLDEEPQPETAKPDDKPQSETHKPADSWEPVQEHPRGDEIRRQVRSSAIVADARQGVFNI